MNENREQLGSDAGAVADSIRRVTARMTQAIEQGNRSRRIDAEDLVEVLLEIAEELDPFPPPE